MKDIVQYHKEGYLTWKVSPSKKVKVGSIVGSKCRVPISVLGIKVRSTPYIG